MTAEPRDPGQEPYRWGLYLTTAPDREKGGLIAVISDGTPQRGHAPVTVLSVERCETVGEAKAWFREQKKTQPWRTRQ